MRLGFGTSSPNRFSWADFRRCCGKSLGNTASIPCGILLASPKISSVKTAAHLWESIFRGIFGAADAALLAQGKDNKPKSTEKGRPEAIRAQRPEA